MTYADALAELSQVPLDQFIAERKRLVGELKAAGDKTGARVLGTRAKPPVSAWVTNQLWWHARDAFEELMASADKLRKGQLAASAEHRDAIAKLRKRAAAMLEQGGHNANEATLRRVAMTLSALAATGGWAPDEPGTLATDRDPPGFEAVGIPIPVEAPAPTPAKHAKPEPPKHTKAEPHAKPAKPTNDNQPTKDELEELREKKRADEQAEKKRAEEEKKRITAEKHRLEAALRTAKAELHDREREVKQLEKQIHAATEKLDSAQELVSDLQTKLDELT